MNDRRFLSPVVAAVEQPTSSGLFKGFISWYTTTRYADARIVLIVLLLAACFLILRRPLGRRQHLDESSTHRWADLHTKTRKLID